MPSLDELGRWTVAAIWIAATFVVVAVAYLVLRRMGRTRPALLATVSHTHRPLQVVALLIAARLTVPPLVESGGWQRRAVEVVLSVLLVVTLPWLVGAVLRRIEDLTLTRIRKGVDNGLTVRRVHTQITIVRRLAVAVVAVLAAGAVLLTFPQARAAGASVLGAAGLAGLIAAFAAQSTLGNLFAGLQLAFGNSLRLDDVVVVEGEWGRIEEITLSYVVVKIWDERRLILPSSYFTSTPFQNWTRSSAQVMGTVQLDVDWTVPVEEMREVARTVAAESDLWDRRAFGLQITEATGGLVRARVMVSAADSGALWDLRCLIREKLVVWLQERHPTALPRTRAEFQSSPLLTGEPS